MSYHNAKDEKWIAMEIKGVPGFFCDLRIKSYEDTKGKDHAYEMYELADGESDGTPCRYARHILVNFYGTFICNGKLPWDELARDGYHYTGYINNESEWAFTEDKYISYDEVVARLDKMRDDKFNKVKQEELKNEETEVTGANGSPKG